MIQSDIKIIVEDLIQTFLDAGKISLNPLFLRMRTWGKK